jgi:hypothetical protein
MITLTCVGGTLSGEEMSVENPKGFYAVRNTRCWLYVQIDYNGTDAWGCVLTESGSSTRRWADEQAAMAEPGAIQYDVIDLNAGA